MSTQDTAHIARHPAGSPDGGKFAHNPGGTESSMSLVEPREEVDLDTEMDFDCAYAVDAHGNAVYQGTEHPPMFYDNELDSDKWEAISGYTGQYGYRGPVMHDSERLAGALTEHMKENPGIYAVIPASYPGEEDPDEPDMGVEDVVEGWVLVRKKDPVAPETVTPPARFHEIDGDGRREMARQIGTMNVLSISGGRVVPIEHGIELPVSNGYSVRIRHTTADHYYVERVFRRGGREWVKGARDDVDFTQVSELAYRAGMFRSFDENEWTTS